MEDSHPLLVHREKGSGAPELLSPRRKAGKGKGSTRGKLQRPALVTLTLEPGQVLLGCWTNSSCFSGSGTSAP